MSEEWHPWRRAPKAVRAATRRVIPLSEVLSKIREMEARAIRKAGEEMPEATNGKLDAERGRAQDIVRRRLDVERIRELHGRGKTPTEIADELGCSRSGVSGILQKLPKSDGDTNHISGHDGTPVPQVNGNGNGNGHAAPAELRALEQIINERWQHLALPDRLRILLQA